MEQNSNSRTRDKFTGLDPSTKYCLVDTMVLLPLVHGDLDVIKDVKRELGGAILVLLNKIVGEAAHKYDEMKDVNKKTDFEDFAALLSKRLESSGIAFRFVRFDRDMFVYWRSMMDSATHPNLSPTDYALLCAAIKRPDMDFMTDDKGLIGSIYAERGPRSKGKRLSATLSYSKRRNDTAGFIKRRLAGYIPKDTYVYWRYRLQCTEFLIRDAVAATVDHSDGDAQVDLSTWVKNVNKATNLQSELKTEIQAFFTKWKPARNKKSPVRGKGWYTQHRDDDDYGVYGLGIAPTESSFRSNPPRRKKY